MAWLQKFNLPSCLHWLKPYDVFSNQNFLRTVSSSTTLFCSTTANKRFASTSVQLSSEDSDISLVKKINSEVVTGSTGRLFAIIHAAGKQRKITTEDIIVLDKPIEAGIGERIRLNKVLLVGGSNFTLVGRPILKADVARVEATVIEKTLSHTKISFWYHRRQDHRVLKLNRISHTYLRINSIELSPLDDTST